MPKFEYTNGDLPSPAEFARQLREASEQYDPVNELLSLERDLIEFERARGLSSAEFYEQFVAGEAGDMPDDVAWASLYEGFMRLKTTISESLKLVVSEPVRR